MKEKIINKQPNSKKCFVCGLQNEFGLNASFYELENGNIAGVFIPDNNHQGYPGRLHGGLAATLIDETIGRAIMINEKNTWGVTVDLSIRFKKPIPIDEEVKVIAHITANHTRMYEGKAEIYLSMEVSRYQQVGNILN
jgi:uncharacterized protein (TIGR00369 family)